MILYYTRSQKTKVFAEALHDIFNMPLVRLDTELDGMGDFKFMIRALGSVFTKRECPVSNIPTALPGEIYLCGPIWGGKMAAPVRYFLKHAGLKGIKVNLLMTASTPVEKYRARALEDLALIDCIPGKAYIFATGDDKNMPEKDVVIQQMHEILEVENSEVENSETEN